MNKLSGFVAVSMVVAVCAPFTANADDIVTLNYQSAPLTGTYSSLVSGLPAADPFVNSTFTGTLDASVVFDETQLALNSETGAISYNFTLNGTGAAAGVSLGFDSYPVPIYVYQGCRAGDYAIGICSSNGGVTGATVDIAVSQGVESMASSFSNLSIGPLGDAATVENTGCGAALQGTTGTTYTGPSMGVCYLQAANSTAGSWTVASAPEIDPGTAGSALTLLAGFAAMVRGRRRATAGP